MTIDLDDPGQAPVDRHAFTPTAVAEPPPNLADLSRHLRAEGCFRSRRGFYAILAAVLVAAAVAIGATLAVIGTAGSIAVAVWWAVLIAIPAALVSTQFGFLGHDAAHGQVARRSRTNRWIGLLAGNLASGLSIGWWKDKHNRHHKLPNVVGSDPDVGDGIIAWNDEQRRRATGLHAWVVRHQHRLFLPLLTFEGWHLAWSSTRSLRDRTPRERLVEVPLLVAHYVGLLAVALWLLPVPAALAFVIVHRAVYGLLLGAAFAPNHIGMQQPTEPLEPVARQVVTSRNVAGGPWLDIAMGGLNWQIEHHLFPSMPRPNLRAAAPHIRKVCAMASIPYHQVAPRRAAAEVYRALKEPTLQARGG